MIGVLIKSLARKSLVYLGDSIPLKMKLDSYSLEQIVKNRARLLDEYNKQGFKRFAKILKKKKYVKKVKSLNVDDLYLLIMSNFDNIFDALFFLFFFLTNYHKKNIIVQRRNSSFILCQVFRGMLNFINFDEMVSLNLISVKNEVKIKIRENNFQRCSS